MSSHAFVEVDSEGVIKFWDAEAMTGFTPEQAVGKKLDLIVPERFREDHWKGFYKAMANPEKKELVADIPVLCASGEEKIFAGRLEALRDGLGTAVGAIAVFSDQGSTGNSID